MCKKTLAEMADIQNLILIETKTQFDVKVST